MALFPYVTNSCCLVARGNFGSIRSGTLNAATATFVAGYGDSPDDVPEEIRQSILFLAAHLYEQREAVVIGTGVNIETVPFAVESLLGMHSMRGF